MAKTGQEPPLEIGRRVTRKHGEAFAEAWVEASMRGSAMSDAFDDTGLIVWPDSDDFMDPAYLRYHDISEAIEVLVTEAVRPAVAEAFVKAAREVLARERRQQK